MSLLGKKINKLIKPLGFQIIRLKKKTEQKSSFFPVENPIKHNSVERMNEFYSDESRINQYIEEGKLSLDFYKKVVSVLEKNDKDPLQIVDVGCGTGHLFLYLNEIYPNAHFTGLEYSDEAIQRAIKYFPKAHYELYDIYKSYGKKFDMVFCTEVLEHLLYPEKALKNLISMLNLNGVLIITVPNGRNDNFLGHINFWSPESWKIFIESNTNNSFDVEFKMLNNNKSTYNLAKIIKNN